MTTYPLTFPSLGISKSTFGLARATSSTVSPFTFNQQVYKFSGSRWEGSVTFRPATHAQAANIKAFLAELDGQYGTFTYGDPDAIAKGKLGAGGGTPLVKGGSQTGTTLNIDGCSNNITGWLKKGDYFSLGSGSAQRLYMLVADANTNGSGETTLEFRPALRSSPADNASVEITSPRGVFRLAGNMQDWSSNHVPLYEITISFVEAISE